MSKNMGEMEVLWNRGYMNEGLTLEQIERRWKAMPTLESLLDATLEMEWDISVGDMAMPATLVWDQTTTQLTAEARSYFKELLQAKVEINRENKLYVWCDNNRLGEEFTLCLAGYCPTSRYNELFGTEGD